MVKIHYIIIFGKRGETVAVTCYYCDVSALAEPGRFARGLDALPWSERQQRIRRLARAEDRRLSLGAGLLLAYALRQAGAEDLTLSYSPQGKPCLARQQGVHFSLSHSGAAAVCAVADRPVGVDVERLRAVNGALAGRVLTAEEQAWLAAQSDPAAFWTLWTRKESYLKLTGEGLSRGMGGFSVLTSEAVAPAGFSEIDIPGYRICVCCEGTDTIRVFCPEFPGAVMG